MSKLNLRAGEWIEVRSKEEILQTLDKNGRQLAVATATDVRIYGGTPNP